MLSIFANLMKPTSNLEEVSQDWVIETFAWALQHFDSTVFQQESQLILPTNSFYPGRVSSIHEMAQAIFDQTLIYVGMQHWPLKLVAPENYQPDRLEVEQGLKFGFVDNMRGAKAKLKDKPSQAIQITYNPNQVNQPQDLVASFVQVLAAIIISYTKKLPPGGEDCLPKAIDLVACFMGFGVMFANTAYQFKGGCGSCYNPYANRQAALNENEVINVLALFSYLKNINIKQVKPHLKSHLRGGFTQTYKYYQGAFKGKTHPLLIAL
tara:strand:- start:1364 stop:2161 length:798 start_codon:yes stop_codon:yes gene_type:complete